MAFSFTTTGTRSRYIAVLVLQLVALSCALASEKISSFQIPEEQLEHPPEGEDVATVVFDDSPGFGRRFDGIGAISGGGATSKLLGNYQEKELNEILDYLFKPNFGASLQIFKVEIGGDAQSTEGTEASHMHDKWDENYSRGYEWWLMQKAKKINPDIKLYALPWTFPGWLGEDKKGTNTPYSNPERTADYVVRWINAAKTRYNLTIDCVGIWNERHYNSTYIKTLRRTLDERGFRNTVIVAADTFKWKIAVEMEKDKELAEAVYAVGVHYPGTFSTKQAQGTGKPLWVSEDFDTLNDDVGGGCWARALNRNYVHGFMTSTIAWNLIDSYFPHLPYFRTGLMTAHEPWGGHYDVAAPTWITAHTTQFASIGWRYLVHESGVGNFTKGGSYVSLTNGAADQLSIIIETMTHDHSICIRPKIAPYIVKPQTVRLKLQGTFAKIKKMNFWFTQLKFDGSKHTLFEKKSPLVFTDGEATLKLGLDQVITLSTVDTARKGAYPKPPPHKPFPQEFQDDFSGYREHQEPSYLTPQMGSIEVRKIDGESVARQTVLQRPVYWCGSETADKALIIIGDYAWIKMNVSVTVSIPSVNGTDGVFVAARVDRGGCGANDAHGIFFFVLPNSKKFIVSNNLGRSKVLKQGSIPPVAGRYRLSLQVDDKKAVGQLDGRAIFSIDVPRQPRNGWGAIGTDSFGYADFDDFSLRGPSHIK